MTNEEKELIVKFAASNLLNNKRKTMDGRTYAAGWFGPYGVLQGLRDLRKGLIKECRFFVAQHHYVGDTEWYAVTVCFEPPSGVEPCETGTFRYTSGAGECDLGGVTDDPAAAAVALVAELYRQVARSEHLCVFRDYRYENPNTF